MGTIYFFMMGTIILLFFIDSSIKGKTFLGRESLGELALKLVGSDWIGLNSFPELVFNVLSIFLEKYNYYLPIDYLYYNHNC